MITGLRVRNTTTSSAEGELINFDTTTVLN